MTGFQTVASTEAHPTQIEYIAERQLNDGTWRNESIYPTPTPNEAEQQVARRSPTDTYRIVERTITSTVISVRPAAAARP